MENVMNRVNNYIFSHSFNFFQNTHTGSIVSKIKSINDHCQTLHDALEFRVSRPVLTTLFSGIGIVMVNVKIFGLVMIFAVIQTSITIYYGVRLNNLESRKEGSWHKIIGNISDSVSNIFTILSFASKKIELGAISKRYDKIHKPLMLEWHRIDFIMSCIQAVIYVLFIGLLFVLITYLKNSNEISLGDIAFTLSLSYVFIDNMWDSINAIKKFTHNIAAFKAAFSIMQIPHDKIDKKGAEKIKIKKGSIKFNEVSFAYHYEGKQVLQNLNLNINPGEKVGLVGYSGAGKSTIISILQKHFRINQGSILIDGEEINNVESDSLRSQISLIPQDTMLFHRTIGENIAYAKPGASFDEVVQAAKKAYIHDFISELEDGYNTLVGERGVKLSGGQRQRIAIARAFLKDAPILILDEATSSLDSQTERHVQKSLDALMNKKSITMIAIAHRLSTLKHMDKIIVLDKGAIIEQGSHDTLLKKKGMYYTMWCMQIDGFIPE
jgi:ATP-binding cassette subfamily B protein